LGGFSSPSGVVQTFRTGHRVVAPTVGAGVREFLGERHSFRLAVADAEFPAFADGGLAGRAVVE
jgi:hypothetical protein